MTHLFIAQSIVRAPDFRGTTLRVAIHTESAVTDCYEIVPVLLKLKNSYDFAAAGGGPTWSTREQRPASLKRSAIYSLFLSPF